MFAFPSLYFQNLDMRHTHIFQDSVSALTFPNLNFLQFPLSQILAATHPSHLSGKQVSVTGIFLALQPEVEAKQEVIYTNYRKESSH